MAGFDELWGDTASSSSSGFDSLWGQEPEQPQIVTRAPTWGESASFVGKSLAQGLAKTGDLGLYLLGEINEKPLQGLVNTYIGRPEDTGITGPVARIAQAAVEGSTFPIGGPVLNALGSAGAEAAHEVFPDSTVAPIIGALGGGSIGAAGKSLGRGISKSALVPGGAERVALEKAANIADELRTIVPDALTEPITIAERSRGIANAIDQAGIAAKKDAGALFNALPEGQVVLDDAINNIGSYAEKLGGPVVPGGRTGQLIEYLKKLRPADTIENVPASSILDEFGQPITAATERVIPGGPAVADVRDFQNILRDVGTIGEGAIGADRAIVANAKDQLLEAARASLPEESLTALTDARKAYAQMATTFQEGAVGSVRESVKDPARGYLTLKRALLSDPKKAEQLVSVMGPDELAGAQNIMLQDLLRYQPVSMSRQITTKLDNYRAVFGEEATDRLLNMVGREGIVGKELLNDNSGLKSLFGKLGLKGAVGGTIGGTVAGAPGAAIGSGLAMAASAGDQVGRVQQLLMQAAAGDKGAINAIAAYQAPSSAIRAALGGAGTGMAIYAGDQTPSSQQIPQVQQEESRSSSPPTTTDTVVSTPRSANEIEQSIIEHMGNGLSEDEAKQVVAAEGAGVSPKIETQPKNFIDGALNRAETNMRVKARPVLTTKEVEEVEKKIDSNPYYSALYETESGRNPTAVPRDPKTGKLLSSAKGGFQFLDGTAKSIGLKNPFDLGESFEKVQELTDQHRKRFGDDPEALYSAHYLGATVFSKLVKGQRLTEKEQQQVKYLETVALPRFRKIYNKVTMV